MRSIDYGKPILSLDKAWEPHRWLSTEQAIKLEAENLVIQHLGEAIFVYHGGKNRMGVQSKLETSSIIVVGGTPNHRQYKEPVLTNPALFQRDRNLCAYCGGLHKPAELTRDHIMPVSKGGKDRWMNVVASCKGCNALKSDLLPGHKLKGTLGPQGTGRMEPLFVPYIPCRAEHMILKNRSIKVDQMEFLLQRVTNKHSRIFKYAEDFRKKHGVVAN